MSDPAVIAAVLRAPDGPFSLEPVVLPALPPDGILVRIHAVGMCKTDLDARQAQLPWPVILGHEGAGVVEAVGADVTEIAEGDHVVLSFDSCGSCHACRTAAPAYCAEFTARNLTGRAGRAPVLDRAGAELGGDWFGQSSFATHAMASARNAVVIDRDVPFEIAGPLGCGVQTGAGAILNVLRPQRGETVLVAGAGGVGLSAILAARLAGAGRIVALEPVAERRELALRLGATDALAPQDADALRALTGEVDCALDTTGRGDAIRLALELLRVGGRCGLLAWQALRPVIGPAELAGRNLTVIGIIEGSAVPQEFIPSLIDLWRHGLFPFEEILTCFPLEEINAAEAAMRAQEVIKPVLIPARG